MFKNLEFSISAVLIFWVIGEIQQVYKNKGKFSDTSQYKIIYIVMCPVFYLPISSEIILLWV